MSRRSKNRLKRHRKTTEVVVPEAAPVLDEPPTPMAELVMIEAGDVAGVWPLVEPLITKAAARGEYSAEELYTVAVNGAGHLWIAWSDHCEAAAITTPVDTPKGRVLVLAACGGRDMGRWIHLISGIERWGKQNGCVSMRIYARKGWARMLKDYRTDRVILDKGLT